MTLGTEIELPEYCHPLTGSWYRKPTLEDCDHDFERDESWDDDKCCHWKCEKCSGIRCYEIYD